MTKRNIAIANFNPSEVFNSSWPRFTGFKTRGNPEKLTGFAGLVDADVQMHAFFENTTIEEVLSEYLVYTYEIRVVAPPKNIIFNGNKGAIVMPDSRPQDHTITWLPPYTYVDDTSKEWDVYVLIKGTDIRIAGTSDKKILSEGYWDMGIWQPKIDIETGWTDTDRIVQQTINYVHDHGYIGKKSITIFRDSSNYGKYENVDYRRTIQPIGFKGLLI